MTAPIQEPDEPGASSSDPQQQETGPDAPLRESLDDVFLRNSSQALRTRFTTLKGFWQLLDRRLRRGMTTAQQDEAAAPLRDEFEHFENLLLQYLDARELQWGHAVHPNSRVDLAELTREALTDVDRRGLVTARHQFQIQTPEDVVGRWDAHWLRDALAHVVVNAVLYSPAGGEIRVAIERAGDLAAVTVEDHGIGVAPDERELIFHPFYRGQRAVETAPGLGLGLFIAGSVVALHGGTVEVDSRTDAGSIFTVRLPLDIADDTQPSA